MQNHSTNKYQGSDNMSAFHKSSAIIGKLCVVLCSVLIASAFMAGCGGGGERSAKNKADVMQGISELSAMQEKVVAMMGRGETAEAKKFAETTLAEKRNELKSSIDDKVLNQLLSEADGAAVLKEFTDKENDYLKKMSAFQTK